jgi:hypothetical protein
MVKTVSRWFKLQPEEIGLFLWTTGLLFLIRISGILFNNFAETTFLKRYGVEYLPLVYAANSIATFVLMGLMTGVMRRLTGARLMIIMLVICGSSVAGLRTLVGLDVSLVYPLLFLLKAQYEALLALIYWNMANDLFNTRQSKRIFPLITAGGVLGSIIGSFFTPLLAQNIGLNNLMLAYLVTTWLGAAVMWHMSTIYPALPLSDKTSRQVKKKQSLIQEIKSVLPVMKKSTLVKILVLLTFLPNVMIPILNYQFNFAVNEAFATEGGLLKFFGYFRGFLNTISFVILLFVGKIYSRWGLPMALLFHPINYVIVFVSFLLRFDIFTAMYARVSTQVLKTTINNPARAVLMGLFPENIRPLIRPFLRGTVVRVGVLLGSGFILLSEGFIHPRYLSMVAMVFGLAWLATVIWLKRTYSDIVLDVVSQDIIDIKSLEKEDQNLLFQDKAAQAKLMEACAGADGWACVRYAQMMKAQGLPDLDSHLLKILKQKDEETVIELLPLISSDAGQEAIETYQELIEPDHPKLNTALARAATRLPLEQSASFLYRLLQEDSTLEVKARAALGLKQKDPRAYLQLIQKWLGSDQSEERRAGAIAAGLSGDEHYLDLLHRLVEEEREPAVVDQILIALHRLGSPQLPGMILTRLGEDPESVPQRVLKGFNVTDEASTKAFIQLLDHESSAVRALAAKKLKEAPELDIHLLIESLALPNHRLIEGLYDILEELKISDLEIISFVRAYLERAYRNLAEAETLKLLKPSPLRQLLQDHLIQKKDARLENILRVLATQGNQNQMRMVLRGMDSSDTRLRSNALEALEVLVGRNLSAVMMPLLEDVGLGERLDAGKRQFHLPQGFADERSLFEYFLAKRDPVTLFLTLRLLQEQGWRQSVPEALIALKDHENIYIRDLAGCLARPEEPAKEEAEPMAEAMNLSDKILLLRGMDIFEQLAVRELAAVAAVAEYQTAAPGEEIVVEGEVGNTMYLIISGKVAVNKNADDGCSVELDDMGPGEYFGEMALFDDQVRSASVIAKEETRLLVLHKREFSETVREYPQVALQMCKELSQRVRHLHQKIQSMPVCF